MLQDQYTQQVISWHQTNGGFNGRPAGHALRMLHEMVELCVASGASDFEIRSAMEDEISKAYFKGEFVGCSTYHAMCEEVADVTLLMDVFCNYNIIDASFHRGNKLPILHEREWEVDSDGVLWRPRDEESSSSS